MSPLPTQFGFMQAVPAFSILFLSEINFQVDTVICHVFPLSVLQQLTTITYVIMVEKYFFPYFTWD